MNFPFSNNSDYVLLYHPGTGGEYLSGILTKHVPQFNRLTVRLHHEDNDIPNNNRWASVSKVTYSKVGLENKNYFTEHYQGEDDPTKLNLYKDHYTTDVFDYWPKTFNCICLVVNCNYEYWARLCYQKLKKINIKQTEQDFFKNFYNNLVNTDIIEFAKHFQNSYIVDIRNLRTSTISDQLVPIFPDLDKVNFDDDLQKWINGNKKLLLNS